MRTLVCVVNDSLGEMEPPILKSPILLQPCYLHHCPEWSTRMSCNSEAGGRRHLSDRFLRSMTMP